MNSTQEVNCTLQCDVETPKLLTVKVNDSMTGDYLNIKVEIDGRVVRKRRALSKLSEKLGSYTDAIEFVIADVLLAETGLTREQLGGMLTEMADAAMYHDGETFVFELIPCSVDYGDYTPERESLQPYRLVAFVADRWQILGRYRAEKLAIYNMLKLCHAHDRMRVLQHFPEVIMATVERDLDGTQWYATSVFGVETADEFTTWHKTHC